MTTEANIPGSSRKTLPKSATGIRGLDEVTHGGLPAGRTTLLCGGPGCGKTVLGMQFLVNGARHFGEPGLFVAFEEPENKLRENALPFGWDLAALEEAGMIGLDYIRIERGDYTETGQYDLEGLFIRLEHQINTLGAKRVVIDTGEILFAELGNAALIRSELRRLLRWLEERNITGIFTSELGREQLTEYGIEEFACDCVIVLDHRIIDEIPTRRLRILKYRGTYHGTNEYPFLITPNGMSIFPITELKLTHDVSTDRVPSGVETLDPMFGGKGYFRGTSVLISGSAGTGKSSFAAHFVNAACQRGERCLYVAFEESPRQILRNMRSIGIDLAPWIDQGLLHFRAERPTLFNLETHLVELQDAIERLNPTVAVIDPVSNLTQVSSAMQAKAFCTRFVDYLKKHGITAVFTSLAGDDQSLYATEVGISSLMDVWIQLQTWEREDSRRRVLRVIKSRGMKHDHRRREYELTDNGIQIVEMPNTGRARH